MSSRAAEVWKNASKYVMTIAKTYSGRYAEILMEKTKKMKPQAALYIQSIEERGILWTSSQWLNVDVTYPPRFGIVTSNTSESVNSMFAGQGLATFPGWMHLSTW